MAHLRFKTTLINKDLIYPTYNYYGVFYNLFYNLISLSKPLLVAQLAIFYLRLMRYDCRFGFYDNLFFGAGLAFISNHNDTSLPMHDNLAATGKNLLDEAYSRNDHFRMTARWLNQGEFEDG
jgi:hypothetical protein